MIIRDQKSKLLKNLDPTIKAKWDEIISQKFLNSSYFHNYHVFACYYPLSYEFSTLKIITALLKAQKKVCLPRIKDQQLIFYYVDDINALVCDNSWKILQPKANNYNITNISDIEVFLIPLIAYSNSKQRIGHGKGFYDRFLASTNKNQIKVACAYKSQKIRNNIKFDEWDQPLDEIINND